MRDARRHDAAPSDEAARRRAIDPERSFIVRAPAGSGKTTLLIRRYLVLLTRVERPEEILCMTFTRKAAGEMRSRVARALQGADDGTPDGDATTHDLARAALAHARRRGWNLLQHPSRLQFYTIDGLCAWLVRQLPHASGLGAPPDVEELSVTLCRRAAARAIARMDDGAEPVAAAARVVLGYLDNHYDRLRALIVEMLERRDQWLELTTRPTDDRARAALEDVWNRVVVADLERLRGAMSSDAAVAASMVACAAGAGRTLRDQGSGSAITACCELTALPPASADALPQWGGLAALLLTASGAVRKTVTKHEGFPSGDKTAKQRMTALLETWRDGGAAWADDLHAARALPAPRYDDRQWEALGALLLVLKQAAAQLNVDIGGFGRCDYIAVSTCARAALGEPDHPTDLALALDYRIRHILVDEFQDTSQAQMRLLELLTAGWDGSDSRTLFLVGDPMQSIYAFRKADVGIYLRVEAHAAARDGVPPSSSDGAWPSDGLAHLALERLTLKANFRSQRPLVDWVNRVFRGAMPGRSEALSGAVVFEESDAVHDDADDANRAGVRCHAYAGKNRADEAAGVAGVVRAEREANADATIAVLARSRSHLPDILRAFTQAGIPYQEIGLESLARRPMGVDLLALTRALLHPADRTAWLAVLRAPWCGLGLHDLDVVCNAGGEVWTALCRHSTLDGLSATARERLARVTPVLARALASRGRVPPARWIENTWLELGGAAVASGEEWPVARLYFDEVRRQCEVSGLRDYDELEAALHRMYVTGGDRGGDGNPVRVMTMHGAKGLEFDVVVIPGLGRGHRGDTKTIMAWNDHLDAGARGRVLMAPVPAPDDDAGGAMYAYLKTLEKTRDTLESARLLYVACTRAKRRLHLCADVGVDDDGGVTPPPGRSLLSHVWASCADEFGGALRVVERRDPAPSSTERGARLLRVPDGWRPPAPAASIPLRPALDDAAAGEAAAPTFDWAGQPARLTGVIVHRMLCRIATQGLRAWNAERVRRCRVSWAAELEAQGLERNAIERVVGDVEKALCFSLDDRKGRWIFDARHSDARNEYDIGGVVNGRPVRRILDRTMMDAEGVRWIIDYKTGSHRGRGSDLDAFLDNERERYRAQLEEYALLMSRMTDAPIRLGLFFPLGRTAQNWREWAWDGGGVRA